MKAKVGAALIVLLVLAVLLAACVYGKATPTPTPLFELDSRSGTQKIRFKSLVVDELFVEGGGLKMSGPGTFDGVIQFNGSVTGGAVTNDLNGGAFILDPTGTTILRSQADDTVTLTSAAGTGTWSVITGNFKVGNGTPGVTQNGEDFYCEGTSEFDGIARFDAAYLDVRGYIDDLAGTLRLNGATSVTGTLTVSTDFTVSSGNVVLPASTIDSTEIANVTRGVNIGLLEFYDCTTNAGALIGWAEGTTDIYPDYINSSTDGLGAVIRFDSTTSYTDTGYICASMIVPPDYASGGSLMLEMDKDAETLGAPEYVNCAGSINGAALGVKGSTIVTGATPQSITCTPTLTALAAGNSINFAIYVTSLGVMDDDVDILAAQFVYTATQ